MTSKYLNLDNFSQINEILKLDKAIIFKHSTQCPISADALAEFESFLSEDPAVMAYYVDVIKDRSLSQKIAQTFNIQHESPQILILERGKVKFNTSHRNIKKQTLLSSI